MWSLARIGRLRWRNTRSRKRANYDQYRAISKRKSTPRSLQVALPPETTDVLTELARGGGVTKSSVLELAIVEYLRFRGIEPYDAPDLAADLEKTLGDSGIGGAP